MAPEYGATCGFFPIDSETIAYLELTARAPERVALVEAYAKAQGMWRDASSETPLFTYTLSLDLGGIVPALAGPKRPQDRVPLDMAADSFGKVLADLGRSEPRAVDVAGREEKLSDGDVTIAAITSCTNTSNPSVLIAAGLVAKAANARGMKVKPWVKTSLAPGSQVVTDYLEKAGLQDELDALGFNLVGYGCTTCIGNSGPLPKRFPTPSIQMIWWSPRCFPATAILKAGSAPMFARTILPARRWWWPMRWQARCWWISRHSRLARMPTATR